MFWTMTFSLTTRAMYVYLGDGKIVGQAASEDNDFIVDLGQESDGTPIVLGLEILEPNRLSIIQDWIEEGIEKALDTLNVKPTDDFADNHWKAVCLNDGDD